MWQRKGTLAIQSSKALVANDTSTTIETEDRTKSGKVPSATFRRLVRRQVNTIHSKVSQKAFDDFIEYCSVKQILLTPETFVDMSALATELDMDCLKKNLDTYMDKFEDLCIAFRMADLKKNNRADTDDYRDLQVKLGKTFLDQVDNPIYLTYVKELGFESVKAVFENNKDLVRAHIHKVFQFMVQCVDKYFGSDAIVLFEGVDFQQLDLFESLYLLLYPRPGKFGTSAVHTILSWAPWVLVVVLAVCLYLKR